MKLRVLILPAVILSFLMSFASALQAGAVDPRAIKQMKQKQAMQAQQARARASGQKMMPGPNGKMTVVKPGPILAPKEAVKVVSALKISAKPWTGLPSDDAKAQVLTPFIQEYHKQGVKIQKPPKHYVGMINAMSAKNPKLLEKPMKDVLQLVAIVEYDFDNGVDKDLMAEKLLGKQAALKNKQRLGLMAAPKPNPTGSPNPEPTASTTPSPGESPADERPKPTYERTPHGVWIGKGVDADRDVRNKSPAP